MGKLDTRGGDTSSIIWEKLEEWARGKVQDFIQTTLEEKVTDLLGRSKAARRQGIDAAPGYRNPSPEGR